MRLSRGRADVDAVRANPARDRRARRRPRPHAAVADERVAHAARGDVAGECARGHERPSVDAREDEHGAAVARDQLRGLGRRDGRDLVGRRPVVPAQERAQRRDPGGRDPAGAARVGAVRGDRSDGHDERDGDHAGERDDDRYPRAPARREHRARAEDRRDRRGEGLEIARPEVVHRARQHEAAREPDGEGAEAGAPAAVEARPRAARERERERRDRGRDLEADAPLERARGSRAAARCPAGAGARASAAAVGGSAPRGGPAWRRSIPS